MKPITRRLSLLAAIFAGLLGQPTWYASPAVAQPFAKPINNASSYLLADHVIGSGQLHLKIGEGSRFGNPTADSPIRVTVARKDTLFPTGQIAPTSSLTIFRVTGRTGDTLTGLTAIEGTADQAFFKNDPVQANITAGTITELQDIVNLATEDVLNLADEVDAKADAEDVTNLAGVVATKADDDAVVKLAGAQTVTGKTFAAASDSATALIVRANSAGQTGDLLQVKDGSLQTRIKVDKDGMQIADLSGTDRVSYLKIKPKEYDPEYPCDFNFNVSSHNFGGFTNNVMTAGWNDLGGSLEKAGYPHFRDVWENNYYQSDQYLFERFVGAVRHPVSGSEIRPIAVGIYTRDSEGELYDQFKVDFGEAWSTKVHLLEDGSLFQKWQWNDATEEWSVDTPGYGLYYSAASCVAGYGGTDRTTVFRLNGSSSELRFQKNGAIKYALSQAENVLYVNGPTKVMGYWNDSQYTSTVPSAVEVSGDGTPAMNWYNSSSADDACNWGWMLHNNGSVRLWNYKNGVELVRFGANGGIGFYGATPTAKPTITGNIVNGSSVQDLVASLAGQGLVTNSTTATDFPVTTMTAESPVFQKITPKLVDPNLPVNLHFSVSSHQFDDYVNNVFSIEWGGIGGGLEVAGMPVMRDGWENRYKQSGYIQNERHVGITTKGDGSGDELRPITISTKYALADGTPLDQFISSRTDTYSSLSHLTEDNVQRQKWEWNAATSEWNQFSPGSAVFLSPTVCSASFGDTGRNTVLKLVGTDNKLAFVQGATEKHSLSSSGDALYVNGPNGQLAYWSAGGELNLNGGPRVNTSGVDTVLGRWINDAAAASAGDWLWRITNSGMLYLQNVGDGGILIKAQGGKLGFFDKAPVTRPEITGSWSDGTAAKSVADALVALGLATSTATP